jgi:PAT family beta-lactamase induction signal transducer AmpG
MYLSEQTRRGRILRLTTLCVLYLAQGIPYGFVTYTLVAYLSSRQLGIAEVGQLTALSTLPWSFKWIWGPVIDRFGFRAMGRRRPWILLAQLMMTLTLAAMIGIPDLAEQFRLLCAMVFVTNVFGALQDVAVDALAVDLLPESERGKANGLMFGSSYFGSMLGGGGLGWVLASFDMRAALMVQAIILMVIMLFPLLLREHPGERLLPWSVGEPAAETIAISNASTWQLLTNLARAFSVASALWGAALALLVKVGFGVSYAVASVIFIQQLGWDKGDYTSATGGYAIFLGIGGSVAGGWLADWYGAKRMTILFTLLLGLLWIAFALAEAAWSYRALGLAFLVLQELLLALLSVSLFAMFMTISSPAVAATQFTTYMSLLNLSNTLGSAAAGRISAILAPSAVFLAIGLFQCALVVVVAAINTDLTRKGPT